MEKSLHREKKQSYVIGLPLVSESQVHFLANRVKKLADAEGISLVVLVPDEGARETLIADAAKDQMEIDNHQRYFEQYFDEMDALANRDRRMYVKWGVEPSYRVHPRVAVAIRSARARMAARVPS